MLKEPRACTRCGAMGHHEPNKCPNLYCRYCKCTGHIITECPGVPPCPKCNRKGHRSENCWERPRHTPTVRIGLDSALRIGPKQPMQHGRAQHREARKEKQQAQYLSKRHSTRSRSASPRSTRVPLEADTSRNGRNETEYKENSATQDTPTNSPHDACGEAGAKAPVVERPE